MKSVLIRKQVLPKRTAIVGGQKLIASIRYDDECGNGHNTFAMTATLFEMERGDWREISGGCLHEEIARFFPELKPYIKWHLCSSDGPLHYLANALYQAGDRDYNGHAAGEPASFKTVIKFGDFPVCYEQDQRFIKWLQSMDTFDLEVISIEHEHRPDDYRFKLKYTLAPYADKWHQCPFDTEREALEFLAALNRYPVKFINVPTEFSRGKKRDFDAARTIAIWPEATDEQLSLPRAELEQLLIDRLPGLLAEFKAAMEKLGFIY